MGIILSEFVANTAKYGYPDGATGTVSISLVAEDGMLKLNAIDNGLGTAAPTPEPTRVSGIGSNIVAAAASNLGGTLTNAITEKGAQLTMLFEAR
ncbi:hypothetical protein [Sulfitobacter undariae]|uniref:hypothetical protein n=1 Tax=Sulfitobacter undariae TaxID=1563671 RepID=UPI003CCE37CD